MTSPARLVLDTNVLSEALRREPDPRVVEFLRVNDARCLTTSITCAELSYGVERLPDGDRKADLRARIDEVLALYEPDALSFDASAARTYGALVARLEREGQPKPQVDMMIAAICLAHGGTLVTRNSADFAHTGVSLVDPWASPSAL